MDRLNFDTKQETEEEQNKPVEELEEEKVTICQSCTIDERQSQSTNFALSPTIPVL